MRQLRRFVTLQNKTVTLKRNGKRNDLMKQNRGYYIMGPLYKGAINGAIGGAIGGAINRATIIILYINTLIHTPINTLYELTSKKNSMFFTFKHKIISMKNNMLVLRKILGSAPWLSMDSEPASLKN